jgi:hypothetical protein
MSYPKQIAVVIDWYGPMTPEEATGEELQGEFPRGLYLATGRLSEKKLAKIVYVGISTNDLAKRLDNHHKVRNGNQVRIEQLWPGEVVSAGISGPKAKKTPVELDSAE